MSRLLIGHLPVEIQLKVRGDLNIGSASSVYLLPNTEDVLSTNKAGILVRSSYRCGQNEKENIQIDRIEQKGKKYNK